MQLSHGEITGGGMTQFLHTHQTYEWVETELN